MSRSFSPPVYLSISGTIVRETDKAILFKISKVRDYDESHPAVWLPISQMQSIRRPADPRLDTIIMISEWIAREKGFLSKQTPGRAEEEVDADPAAYVEDPLDPEEDFPF